MEDVEMINGAPIRYNKVFRFHLPFPQYTQLRIKIRHRERNAQRQETLEKRNPGV